VVLMEADVFVLYIDYFDLPVRIALVMPIFYFL
jgi:hypothetical protein